MGFFQHLSMVPPLSLHSTPRENSAIQYQSLSLLSPIYVSVARGIGGRKIKKIYQKMLVLHWQRLHRNESWHSATGMRKRGRWPAEMRKMLWWHDLDDEHSEGQKGHSNTDRPVCWQIRGENSSGSFSLVRIFSSVLCQNWGFAQNLSRKVTSRKVATSKWCGNRKDTLPSSPAE